MQNSRILKNSQKNIFDENFDDTDFDDDECVEFNLDD